MWSYRYRLQAAFVALGLAAIGVTGWEASLGASQALREATYDRLTAICKTRCRQLERYFEDATNHVLALSTDEATITALEQFREAWRELPPAEPRSQEYEALRRHYEREFAPRLKGEPAGKWFPEDGRARTLQYHYIAANPNPVGAKDLLLSAPGAGRYGAIHTRYHPTLHRYQSAFGFYDIFLIDGREGRILYTVFKEVDLGMRVTDGPYRDTTLARAYHRAMAVEEPETVVIEDYAPYAASHFAPAAFLAAPVWRAGAKIGVLAIQVPVAELNRVMMGEGQWREEGLGETGHAYIVGPDHTLRSDLRYGVRGLQLSPEVAERVERQGTAILQVKVSDEVAARVRSRGRGTEMGVDDRGVRVLRSHHPLEVPGLDWALVAEIEAREALAAVRALQWRIWWIGLLVAAVFFLAAGWLAGSVTRPVLALAQGVRRLGGRDFGTRVAVETGDEIGELAASFNRMAEELEQTTVSKEELDRTLGALMNAVFVIDAGRGAGVDEMLAAPVRQANRAAAELVGCASEEDLVGHRLAWLVPDGDGAWRGLLETLAREERLPAVEASVARRGGDGSIAPVLVSAAVLPEEPGKPAGIVLAAQDITERKRAEMEVRQKQHELEVLAGRLLTAQEEERSWLARELHDDLTQRLAAVAIEAGRLERIPPEDGARWRTGLRRIKEEMARASDDVHRMSRRLHPSMLHDLGLAAAIESECRGFFERGGPPVELVCEGAFETMPEEAQLGLYRMVQEGLRNVQRHAEAEEVSVSLRRGRHSVELEIRDSGRGFDAGAAGWRPGLGLASMEERARLLGGRFHVWSRAGEGTRIEVSLPYGDENGQAEDPAGG